MFRWVFLLNVYGKPIFYFKIFNTLDLEMEMNVIVEIVLRDFNQHILPSVINGAMETNISFVVVIGA